MYDINVKPVFKTNKCVAISLSRLDEAEKFYSGILGLKLIEKNESRLVYDTGHFLLYIDKGDSVHPPVPSFSVDNIENTRELLEKNGCEIVTGDKNWFWFKDPFGIVYDVILK